jgi:hypothetical protein
MATLTITTGPQQGQRVDCDRTLIIGREGVDLVVDDDEMSRRHAVVTPVPAGIEIEDLGSLNGTFVDGERISGKVIVAAKADVKMGMTHFTVEVPASDVPPTVVRNRPAIADAHETVVRDQPIISVHEPTVVREAWRGVPGAPQPGGGSVAGAGPGGPPKLPAPLQLVMKSPLGKLLLPAMMRLPPKARALVPLLVLALVVVAAILLLS